jgi:hypothetical protein
MGNSKSVHNVTFDENFVLDNIWDVVTGVSVVDEIYHKPIYRCLLRFKPGTYYKGEEVARAHLRIWISNFKGEPTWLREQIQAVQYEKRLHIEKLQKLKSVCPSFGDHWVYKENVHLGEKLQQQSWFNETEFYRTVSGTSEPTGAAEWVYNFDIQPCEAVASTNFSRWLCQDHTSEDLTAVLLQVIAACYVLECTEIVHNNLVHQNVTIEKHSVPKSLVYNYNSHVFCCETQYLVKIVNFDSSAFSLGDHSRPPPANSSNLNDLRNFMKPFCPKKPLADNAMDPADRKIVCDVLNLNICPNIHNMMKNLIDQHFLQKVCENEEGCLQRMKEYEQSLDRVLSCLTKGDNDDLCRKLLGVGKNSDKFESKLEEFTKGLQMSNGMQKKTMVDCLSRRQRQQELLNTHPSVNQWLQKDDIGNFQLAYWSRNMQDVLEVCDVLSSITSVGEILAKISQHCTNRNLTSLTPTSQSYVYSCDKNLFNKNGNPRSLTEQLRLIPGVDAGKATNETIKNINVKQEMETQATTSTPENQKNKNAVKNN